MDAKDLQNLHRATDGNVNMGKSNEGSQNKYATKWCGNVDHASAENERRFSTADERGEVCRMGDVFKTVIRYQKEEKDLCKIISSLFLSKFKDYAGCIFDYKYMNGREYPILKLVFSPEPDNGVVSSDKFHCLELNKNSTATVYDQKIGVVNRNLSSNKCSYHLTEEVKEYLSHLCYDWAAGPVKVDHEAETRWISPNWNKFCFEQNANNRVSPYVGYSPSTNYICIVVTCIDPDKVFDLLFTHAADSNAEEYLNALKNKDYETYNKLRIIRRYIFDKQTTLMAKGMDRMITIETMSREDWNNFNDVISVNREMSNTVKCYK